MAKTPALGLTSALDEASVSRFHLRAVLVSGMGFFTDAYDLFVIGIAATLIRQQWHLGSGQLALLNSPCWRRLSWAHSCSAGWPTSWAASGCTGWSR